LSFVVAALNNKGYDVNTDFEPQSGGKGEFYIYKITNDKREVVFSNSKNHVGAVIGSSISSKNYEKIVEQILA
jgi:hypothetical protein